MTAEAAATAHDARRAVLQAEYGAQQRALSAKEGELRDVSDVRERHRLEQDIAWHRETLTRLEERLRDCV